MHITPTFTTYEGDDPLGFVIAANLARRHLSESQRAMVAAKLANMKEGRPSNTTAIAGVSQSRAAAMLNVSADSVGRARAVIGRGAPELVEMVEKGQVAVSAAAQVIQLPVARQREVVRWWPLRPWTACQLLTPARGTTPRPAERVYRAHSPPGRRRASAGGVGRLWRLLPAEAPRITRVRCCHATAPDAGTP